MQSLAASAGSTFGSVDVRLSTVTEGPVSAEYGVLDNTFAWLLGVAPFVVYVIEYWLASAFGIRLPLLLDVAFAVTVNSLIVKVDESRLANAGYEVSAWWGGFLVPVYLWKRNNHVATTQGSLGVWILSFVISLVLPVPAQSHAVTYQPSSPSGNYQPATPSGHNEQRCTQEWVPNPDYSMYGTDTKYDVSPGTWEDKCRWYWVRD
ncbi:MAG: hypothetical protein EBS15_00510 [Actinobacteria bacterium]|nr:hypothetical protein [Actinomycetota bacterium]